MNVLIYGLQRSGTNYLESLIKKSFRVCVLNNNKERSSPLQKHFRLYDDKRKIPEENYANDLKIYSYSDFERKIGLVPDCILVISKDPYSWLLSYKNWAKKCNWKRVDHHYIEEYELFYKKWIDFSAETNKIHFVRYVDLLKDSNRELDILKRKFNFENNLFSSWLKKSIRKVPQSKNFSNKKREYYLKELYLNDLTKKEKTQINNIISEEIFNFLLYSRR